MRSLVLSGDPQADHHSVTLELPIECMALCTDQYNKHHIQSTWEGIRAPKSTCRCALPMSSCLTWDVISPEIPMSSMGCLGAWVNAWVFLWSGAPFEH